MSNDRIDESTNCQENLSGRGILGTIYDRCLSFGIVLAVGVFLLVTLSRSIAKSSLGRKQE